MGKVEKVIVLSVLFLIALILVVSLTVDDPLDKTRIVEAGAPAQKAAATGDAVAAVPTPTPTSSNGFLSIPVDPKNTAAAPDTAPMLQPVPLNSAAQNSAAQPTTTPAPVQPAIAAAPSLPPGALLKKLDGLQDSMLADEFKLYTWKEGDTYRSVAQNYYGNAEKFTLLRRVNEGHADVKPGQNIFVPVFDTNGASDASKTAPVTIDSGKPAKAKKGTEKSGDKAVAAKESAQPSGKKVHLVKEGESLWKIAKEELGNGGRWKEIYEINKDVLSSPDAVHKGLRLRIP